MRAAWLWLKWWTWHRWMVTPEQREAMEGRGPYGPAAVYRDHEQAPPQQCAICNKMIEPGDEYLIAAYGPVHRNGDCEHQSYHVSRLSPDETMALTEQQHE